MIFVHWTFRTLNAILPRMGNSVNTPRQQTKLHILKTGEIDLAWLSKVIAVNVRKAATAHWHRHKNLLELIYCLRGEMRYDFRDRPSITLPSGSFLVIPPDVEHSITSGVDEPGQRLALHIMPRMPKRRKFAVFSSREFACLCKSLLDKAFKPAVFSRTTAGQLACLWNATVGEKELQSPILSSKLRLFVCTILYVSAVSSPTSDARTGCHPIDETVRWLENHSGETVRIAQLAAHIGYSRARLFDLFKARTGLSPAEYLKRLRIRRAKELLKAHPEMSVADIGREVGFRDPSHFTASFRQMTGSTPGAARRKACP